MAIQTVNLKIRFIVLIVTYTAIAFSCSPLYIPSARTMNDFSSKGEANASGMIDLSGFEGSAAISVTNHLMVHGSFSKSIYGLANARDTNSVGGMEGSHNHRMMEIGAGYFAKILGQSAEFQGGYSHGKSDVFEDPSRNSESPPRDWYSGRIINGAYDRFYIQGGMVFTKHGNNTMSFVIRVSGLKFSRIESETKGFVFDTRHRFYFLEPAIDVKHNIEHTPLYLRANIGFSKRIDNAPGRSSSFRGSIPEHWAISNTIGVGIHLEKFKRNQH